MGSGTFPGLGKAPSSPVHPAWAHCSHCAKGKINGLQGLWVLGKEFSIWREASSALSTLHRPKLSFSVVREEEGEEPALGLGCWE